MVRPMAHRFDETQQASFCKRTPAIFRLRRIGRRYPEEHTDAGRNLMSGVAHSGIALLGAAGAVGSTIAAALRAQATPYRVVGRSPEHLRKAFGSDPLAEIMAWNLEDGLSIRKALTGIDTAIYLIGVNY